jgi:hypothetical protein
VNAISHPSLKSLRAWKTKRQKLANLDRTIETDQGSPEPALNVAKPLASVVICERVATY